MPIHHQMLQLLQFEVGVHRDDPSTRVWLQRAAETEGLTAEHVDWMGVICLQQHKPELGLYQCDRKTPAWECFAGGGCAHVSVPLARATPRPTQS